MDETNKLRKVLENKDQARVRLEHKLTTYPTQEVLGSITLAQDFAKFYFDHKIDLELVEAFYLNDFCSTQEFAPSDLKHFRAGIGIAVNFFKNCSLDVDSYIKEAEKNK